MKEPIACTFWRRCTSLLSQAVKTYKAINGILNAFARTSRPRNPSLLSQALEICEAIENIQFSFADIGHLDIINSLTRAEEIFAQAERSLLGFVNDAQIAPPTNLGREIADTDLKRTQHGITPSENKVAKTKRGLPGFINGSRTAALADTGAAQNIISADFAFRNGVILEGRRTVFRLGNSRRVQSAGQSTQAVHIVAVVVYTC